jgi:hypothetical protein
LQQEGTEFRLLIDDKQR